MSWVGAIIVIIWLVRVFTAQSDGRSFGHARNAWSFVSQRGRVAGRQGPDMRSFHGRAGRVEWWVQSVWNSAVSGFVIAVPMIGPVLALPWIYGGVALSVRRLHDLGQSGWLVLAPFAFAAAGAGAVVLLNESSDTLVKNMLDVSDPVKLGLRVSVVLAAAGVGAFFLWLAAVGNDTGPNQYGEADRY